MSGADDETTWVPGDPLYPELVVSTCMCGTTVFPAMGCEEWVCPECGHLNPDDPSPTTGGPVDYELADGCRCYIREDADWGEVLTRPPGGCPVHSCTCLDEAMTGQHSEECLRIKLGGSRG